MDQMMEIEPVLPGSNGANGDDNGALGGSDGAEMNVGLVRGVSIDHEMRTAYLDYAMSVIVARALPDARDGLKPVHRRILYAMHDMGLGASTSYKKSARIVGEVLGKYHPHGDTAVYDAMARMAQDFSLRYCLVDGQGNFGSVDGDSPAAMRYTEARLSRIAETMLQDIEMDTVDWQPNFDDSLEEPRVLPGMLPNFLVNGTSGIAVGMATNAPPHNLREIADAVVYVIDNWERRDDIGLEELMHFVKGPDFPTGGIILGSEGITQAYGTGRGKIIVRAATTIEEMRTGRFRIIVTEIPYQVNKSTLIERIAELVREGKLEGMISDLRDESDRTGMRIVIELKPRRRPQENRATGSSSTHTLQTSFGVNTLALVKGEPTTLGLRRALIVYIEHRFEVLTRRTEYQLGKARERAHILEGLRIALEFLDEVIRTIRESANAEAARNALMQRFGLSQVQAQAILDMQLRRLAALERQKIEDEYQEIIGKIAYYEDLLANPDKILALVREDILMLRAKFGDDRRT
jgi:DNA gyrase subunit A